MTEPGNPPPLLLCGHPRERPASFSRFVLPFRYRPLPAEADREAPFFRPLRLDELDPEVRRRHYLTGETAKALFRRSRWFELCWSGRDRPDLSFTVERRDGGGSYEVAYEPPQLVLFEWERASSEDVGQALATGFLLVDLVFPDRDRSPTLDDLLELNELFRRWREPFPTHEEERGYRRVLGEVPVELAPGGARVAAAVGAAMPERYFDRWASLLHHRLRLSDPDGARVRWLRLFPEAWESEARRWCSDPLPPEGSLEPEGNGWVVYADSRTFVWTCAVLPRGARDLAGSADAPAAAPCQEGRWIKLLNVDAPGEEPDAASAFERAWATARTYRRWEEAGTLYGFTFHSGAMLAPPVDPPPLHRHFADVYFDQVLLLLYLRVTSFRFSEHSSALSARIGHEDDGALMERFRELRRAFAAFTNLYEFPLVSNQEQAIEMYALAREHLDVEAFFSELEDEIRSAHEYFEMVETESQSREMLVLTAVATLGIPAAVVTGFFGMNILIQPLFAGDGVLREGLYVLGLWLAGVLATALFAVWTARHRERVRRLLHGGKGRRRGARSRP